MKRMHFKKAGLIVLTLMLLQNSFAQTKRILPPYYIFNDLEKLLSVDIGNIAELSKTRALSPDEINQLITYTNDAENRLNGSWATVYMGFLKRVEASILFRTALVFSQQPNFSADKKMLKDALYYVSNGFKYLNELPSSVYPPYVILDQKTTYNDNNTESTTSTNRLNLTINMDLPNKLLAVINNNLGSYEESLKAYYSMFDYNYALEPKTAGSRYYYDAAVRINELATYLKRYDQTFFDFCNSILFAIENGKISNISTAEINNLRTMYYQSLNNFISNTMATKYKLSFPRDFREAKYEWQIPYLYQLDVKGKLVAAADDFNQFNYPERSYTDLIRYCCWLLEDKKVTGELATAVNGLLQNHFKDIMLTAKVWFKYSNQSDCEKVKWIAERMSRYTIDEKDVKWVNKKLKKCEKENKGLVGTWVD